MVNGEYLTYLSSGAANQQNSNTYSENAMISYLGRVNYIFGDKYYLTGTFRRDGTSRLSKDNRWGNFPSVSGAWRISKENFFNVPWIDDLKIRGNWGRLGNSTIGDWDYLATINQSIVTVIGGTIKTGATQVKLANENLKWETKETVNVGLDAAFLGNRLTFTSEYYNSKTSDVLFTMPIAISTGNDGGDPRVNSASLRNSGFEFTLGWKDNISDFSYSAVLNVTTINNKLLELGYGKDFVDSGEARSEAGRQLGEFFLLKTDGLFRTQAEIDSYVSTKDGVTKPITINGKRPQLGDVRYIDTNNDGMITADDRQYVGSPWAKAQVSLILNAAWRGFDFSMMWYGQFGNKVYNIAQWQGRYFADNSNYLRFKKGEEPYQVNPNSDTPRIIYGDWRNTQGSDRYLENGSFFRMKNISLGYTFRGNWMKKAGVDNLRVYASGNNLLTLTKYKGLDPDFVNTNIWNMGTDSFAYPNTRSVMFGVEFTF